MRLVLATLLVSLIASYSHAADPRINRIEPAGAQRGTELTVRIIGDRLGDGPEGLLLNEPGIELLEIKPGEDKRFPEAKLKIAADCPLGRHAVRLRTASGLSNQVTFHIGSLPESSEQEPNDNADSAQAIESGVVINGVVKREDIDCFAIELAEGERLSIDVEGLRLGWDFFDPAIEVIGPAGDVVAESDDAPATHQDPSLTMLAPAAGRYVLRLREAALRGGDRAFYRLHVGKFPRPAAVYPPVVQRGIEPDLKWIDETDGKETSDVEIIGVELIGLESDEAQAFATSEHGASPTGLPVRVVEHPVVRESEPNQQRDQAIVFTAPASCVGVIGEAGDSDLFRFSAKKNETWDIRCVARKLRSPMDAVVRVLAADGRRLAGNDDDQGQPDSYVRFRAPEDGEYLIQVEDHLDRGGPSRLYAIDVTRPSPKVELTFHERRRYIATTIDVPQGGRTAVLLNAKRIDVGGPFDLTFDNLPEGVSVEAPRIVGNYFRTPVLLTADESAPTAGSLISITAHRENDAPLKSVFTQQEWFVRGQNNVDMWSYWADRAPVAVTKKLPFSIRLVEPRAPIVRDGSKDLRVVAERGMVVDKPFNGSIRVQMLYHPPGVSSNTSRSVRQGESEAVIPVTANSRASTGDWPIVVTGEADVGGRVYTSTQIVTLRVAEPHLALTMPKAAATQGESIDYTVAVEPRTPFEGAAKCELVGLPPGVSAQPVEVAADAESIPFRLKLAADARVGRHRSIACRVVIQEKGEPITHTLRGGELVVDPAPKQDKNQRTASRPQAGKGASS